MKRNVNHFGTIYGLLAFTLLVGVIGAWKGLTYKVPKADPTLAHKADVRKALGEASLGKVACDFTTKSAANQGVILSSCKVKSVRVKGNSAIVELAQTDNQGTRYNVEVNLAKGVWTALGFKVK